MQPPPQAVSLSDSGWCLCLSTLYDDFYRSQIQFHLEFEMVKLEFSHRSFVLIIQLQGLLPVEEPSR